MALEALNVKDGKILYELDIDARLPLSKIAKKVGLSKEVVNYRINRLIETGILRGFYARIDTSKLGYTLYRTFLRMQNFSPQKEKEFIGHIMADCNVGFFVRVEGNYDFNFIYWGKSLGQYLEFWKELNEKFGKFIQKKELNILAYYANYPKGFLVGKKDLSTPFFECGRGTGVLQMDKLDYTILEVISTKAREPLIDIAKQLGSSDKVVAYRIKRLEQLGVIHSYGIQLNFEKLGLHYYKLNLFLKDYSKDRFDALRNFAIAHQNVVFTDESLGGPDFEIELYMKEKQDYYNFLSELRYKFSDIIRDFETLYYPEEFKLFLFPKTTEPLSYPELMSFVK